MSYHLLELLAIYLLIYHFVRHLPVFHMSFIRSLSHHLLELFTHREIQNIPDEIIEIAFVNKVMGWWRHEGESTVKKTCPTNSNFSKKNHKIPFKFTKIQLTKYLHPNCSLHSLRDFLLEFFVEMSCLKLDVSVQSK